jgi:hypothetical protein
MNLMLDFGVNTFTELLAAASNETFETEIRSIDCWFSNFAVNKIYHAHE